MKGFHLNKNELDTLHKAHREERNKRYAYRIHAIILLGSGYTVRKVKEVLFLDDETLRTYVNNYRIDGIAGLLCDNRSGRLPKLTDNQIEDLKLVKSKDSDGNSSNIVISRTTEIKILDLSLIHI